MIPAARRGTLVVIAAAVLPAVAEAAPCETLNVLSADALRHYEFAARERPLDDFPAREFVVGDVRIVNQPIFDLTREGEDTWLFRLANRLHVQTHDEVIRDVVLFAPGEPSNKRTLAETERILRDKPYLYDARVVPRRLCGDVLDIDVITRDVWTLNPRISLSREGGENEYGFGVSDPNVLGTGKALSLGYESNQDRAGFNLYFEDPNVAGSRVRFVTALEDNDDGSRQAFDLRRPFFSLDTRYSAGIVVDRTTREDSLFALSEEVSDFEHDLATIGVFGGVSGGVRDGVVQRWLFGYTYEDHDFDVIPGETLLPLPEDRLLGYPWVGFERIEVAYDTTVNLDRIQRTEDLFLGRRYGVEIGYSDDFLGGEGARLIYGASFEDGIRFERRDVLRYGVSVDGYYRFDTDRVENLVFEASASYLHGQSERFSLFAGASFAYTRHLTRDLQLLAGGEEGLRGYPTRYQSGDRRLVFTLEERYFSDLYLFRLVRVGTAAFLDVGRAWAPDTPDGEAFGWLADIGVGLRLESTRTRRDTVYHIDLAFPLTDGPDISSPTLTLTVKQSI